VRLDERLNQIDKRFEQIDKRFEQVDKRFEQVDKRFEQVDKRLAELREDMNKRFEQVDKRFESLQNIMMAIVGAFAAIVAVAIGFAIWDRRTMIRPFENTVKAMEKNIDSDTQKIDKVISALREYAKKDSTLSDILKACSLL
jgi:DNA repair exonuclease SbcCD ATPase subunit